jgi:AraC-like DNA-binding protein
MLLLQTTGERRPDGSFTEEAEIIEIETDPAGPSDSDALLQLWKPRLRDLMEKEKLFQDPELSLTQIARQLQTNPSLVSMLVNKGFGMNFNDYVNRYRVEAVKELFAKGEHKKQTLLSIAFECGFNSKATFNRAFKKETGQTPGEWLKQH